MLYKHGHDSNIEADQLLIIHHQINFKIVNLGGFFWQSKRTKLKKYAIRSTRLHAKYTSILILSALLILSQPLTFRPVRLYLLPKKHTKSALRTLKTLKGQKPYSAECYKYQGGQLSLNAPHLQCLSATL